MVIVRHLLLLGMLALPIFCRAAVLTLPPGSSRELSLPAAAGSQIFLLRVRSRLVLPSGCEAWGGYLLEMNWNAAALPEAANTSAYLIDFCRLPLQKTALYSADEQRWFVRADSDYIPFNAQRPGSPYQRENFLGAANSGSDVEGYRNAYYDKVFRLPAQKQENILSLRNHSADYPMHFEIDTWQSEQDDCLFFVPHPGRIITSGTFPNIDELQAPRRWRACPGERQALLLGARALKTEQNFIWKLESWRNAAGDSLSAECFDVRFLTYKIEAESKVPREYRHYEQNPEGAAQLPDRLVSATDWQVPAGESRLMWIIGKIPTTAAPGVYRSQLYLNDKISLPLEVEVLPFKLAESSRVYGLWTNSLPGRDLEARQRQCQDLREHGINTFFLDPWTVPVPLSDDGTPDLRRFNEALLWLQDEGFNKQALIYGILGPLLQSMEKLAGSATSDNTAWCSLAAKVFLPMQAAAEKAGFTLYLHPYDEPDVHPKITAAFIAFCQAIRSIPGLKIASNISASGQMRFADLIDLNICNSGYEALAAKTTQPNHFFPDWSSAEPEWMRENVRYVYTQVRAAQGHQARLRFGLAADSAALKGVWGFAYHWGTQNWNVAWPFPEEDGRCGSTFAWELLSLGIQDSRYWATLQKQRPQLQLPNAAEMMKISSHELARWREEMIDSILQPSYQPQLNLANPASQAYKPTWQVTATLGEGLEQVPVENYWVYPGNLYKHFWNNLDRDWTGSPDPAQRQGLLCNDTPVPANASNVCYNFWRCQPSDSYISVVLQLPDASEVAAVSVEGSRLSSMYAVSHAELSGSMDGLLFTPPGAAIAPDPERSGLPWELVLPGCGKARFLLVSVWTGANNYLNLRKIKVYKKDVSKAGK